MDSDATVPRCTVIPHLDARFVGCGNCNRPENACLRGRRALAEHVAEHKSQRLHLGSGMACLQLGGKARTGSGGDTSSCTVPQSGVAVVCLWSTCTPAEPQRQQLVWRGWDWPTPAMFTEDEHKRRFPDPHTLPWPSTRRHGCHARTCPSLSTIPASTTASRHTVLLHTKLPTARTAATRTWIHMQHGVRQPRGTAKKSGRDLKCPGIRLTFSSECDMWRATAPATCIGTAELTCTALAMTHNALQST